ncbi:MAG: ribosome maturation factor RimP [Actinomycetota bacterium]
MGALEEVRDLAEAVARRRSLRLWDVELGGRDGRLIMRVYVDSDTGVDLDTIAEVSEEISRGLDLRDPIAGRYALEVSSPGLERTLRRPQHFTLSVGHRAIVKTRRPVVGASNRFEGEIVDADDASVRMRVEEGADEVVALSYDDIKVARTVFEWS